MNDLSVSSPSIKWQRLQIALLIFLSILILLATPSVWNYTPDGGFYIGSAHSLIEEGRYWFNGNPNLLYYPGTSFFLVVPMLFFGINFQILHLSFALVSIAVLWVSRQYFSVRQYGWTGLALPLVLASNQLFQSHAHLIISDVLFLLLVIVAIYLWEKFRKTDALYWFILCTLVVAVSPLVRFHGLFLLAAFGISVLHYSWQRRFDRTALFKFFGIAFLAILPFLLWTARNYYLHTDDTYNMANDFFFGLQGQHLSGQGFRTATWIDAQWKYPVYQAMFLFGNLGNSFFGEFRKYLPLELVTVFVLSLLALGGWVWIRRTSLFESIFVVLYLGFLVQQFIGKGNMYIVQRYWLPLLPFLILMFGLSFRTIAQFFKNPRASKRIYIVTSVFTALLIGIGIQGWSSKLADLRFAQISKKFNIAKEATDFVQDNTPTDAILLSSDWGVGPLLTDRKSYVVIRSSCDRSTLELILDKKTEYLLIIPRIIQSQQALKMAHRYPQVFERLFKTGERKSDYAGEVYQINREPIPEVLNNLKCPWEK